MKNYGITKDMGLDLIAGAEFEGVRGVDIKFLSRIDQKKHFWFGGSPIKFSSKAEAEHALSEHNRIYGLRGNPQIVELQ